MPQQVYIIEDDKMMAECIGRAVAKGCSAQIRHFTNAIEAMTQLDSTLPDLIFLDILLDGPDGFSFLNELISYRDTSIIPIVIITSLNLTKLNLSAYNIVQVLAKDSFCPTDIIKITKKVLNNAK